MNAIDSGYTSHMNTIIFFLNILEINISWVDKTTAV